MTDGRMCGAVGKGFARYNFATPRPIMRQSIEQMARALAER
jgi:cystathionine beta-lyase